MFHLSHLLFVISLRLRSLSEITTNTFLSSAPTSTTAIFRKKLKVLFSFKATFIARGPPNTCAAVRSRKQALLLPSEKRRTMRFRAARSTKLSLIATAASREEKASLFCASFCRLCVSCDCHKARQLRWHFSGLRQNTTNYSRCSSFWTFHRAPQCYFYFKNARRATFPPASNNNPSCLSQHA